MDYLASALRGPPQPSKQLRSAAASPTSSRHGQEAAAAGGKQSARSGSQARAQASQQLNAAADVLQAVNLEVANIGESWGKKAVSCGQ